MPPKSEDSINPFKGLFGSITLKFNIDVDRILKSGDVTIVFWSDGTKTVVKRSNDESYSDYAAFTAALAIKNFGTNSAVKRLIAKKTEIQKPKKEKNAAGATGHDDH